MTRILAALVALLALPTTAFADVTTLSGESFQRGFFFGPAGLSVNLVFNVEPTPLEGWLSITAGKATKFEKIYQAAVHTETFFRFDDVVVDLFVAETGEPDWSPPVGHFTARIPTLSFTVEDEDQADPNTGLGPPWIWDIEWRFRGHFDQALANYLSLPVRRGYGSFSVVVAEDMSMQPGTPDEWRNAYMNQARVNITVPEPSSMFLASIAAVSLLRRARRSGHWR